MSVHYKLTVEYDGTAFAGFQVQANARTVQGELEAALQRLNRNQPVRLRGAGRTDAGVHAIGQVVDFWLDWRHEDARLVQALNAILPHDVAVRDIARVPESFHSRYSARSRSYRYTIWNRAVRRPLVARWSLHEPRRLDAEAMHTAVQMLLGTHDFASFGRPTQGESTVRHMMRAQVWRDGDWVYVDLEANAFLYRMVRRIVGTLLIIGRGEAPPVWMQDVLAARRPDAAGATAPPHGLCLMAVRYAEDETEEQGPLTSVGAQESES